MSGSPHARLAPNSNSRAVQAARGQYPVYRPPFPKGFPAMNGASAGYVLCCLRDLCSERDRTMPEAELLDRFAQGDESAFAELLRRHGPLVWGACRRVLGNAHNAEDAFQATFL